jgi:hypothetical protein
MVDFDRRIVPTRGIPYIQYCDNASMLMSNNPLLGGLTATSVLQVLIHSSNAYTLFLYWQFQVR